MIKYKCSFPGCCNLLEVRGYCEKHKKYDKRKDFTQKFFVNAKRSNSEFYNTTKWRELRKEKLKEQPICEKCGRSENLEVHHLLPPKGDKEKFFDFYNLSVLCKKCHFQETLKEVKECQEQKGQKTKII